MWRGLEQVKMIWNGSRNDPELKYDWIVANYWTIEDYLYELFKEDTKDEDKLTQKERDLLFGKRLKENFYEVEDIFEQVKENNL